ncbi:MAG: alpha/beta hydrolase [Granulosicoccus sp.]
MNESAVAVNEEQIELFSAKTRLIGTLTLPSEKAHPELVDDKPVATVLLLADSGPLDRNQNSMQVQLNIFNDIANYLADQGIASVRYDKRGCGLSKGDFNAAGHSDLVADAQAWLKHLEEHPAVVGTPLFVLGHGEGSVMAPQLVAANDGIQGQILLTPFVEDYENIIRRQAENALRDIAALEGFKGTLIRFFLRLSGNQLAKQKKLVQKIRKTRRNTLKIRKQVINAKWIREMVNLDAQAIHSKVKAPTLIIGGQKDLQCLPEDVEKVEALIEGPVQSHILDDLTHILRSDADNPSVQHYLMLSLEDIDRRMLDIISRWLHEHARQTSTGPTLSKA